jgi:hypothetical protein
MPETRVIFYQDEDGDAPVLDWLDELARKDPNPATHTYEEEEPDVEN